MILSAGFTFTYARTVRSIGQTARRVTLTGAQLTRFDNHVQVIYVMRSQSIAMAMWWALLSILISDWEKKDIHANEIQSNRAWTGVSVPRELMRKEPDAIHPFKVRGRLEFFHFAHNSGGRFRIQDDENHAMWCSAETEAVKDKLHTLSIGDLVELEGHTNSEIHRLAVESIKLIKLGDESDLIVKPSFNSHEIDQWLYENASLHHYVRHTGTVASVCVDRQAVMLRFREQDGLVGAIFYPNLLDQDWRKLVGQRVNIHGIMLLDRHHKVQQHPALRILSCERWQLKVDTTSRDPPTPLAFVSAATVSYLGDGFFIADGYRVESDNVGSLRIGSVVDFELYRWDPATRIGRAGYLKLRLMHGNFDAVQVHDASEFVDLRYRRVTIDAEVTGAKNSDGHLTLDLEFDGKPVQAVFMTHFYPKLQAMYFRGNRLKIQGILEDLSGTETSQRSNKDSYKAGDKTPVARIWVARLSDVTQHSSITFLHTAYLIWGLVALVTLGLVVGFWHLSLKRQVRRVTDELILEREEKISRERLRVVGEMAAGVVHDLRNVLTPITILTDIAQRDDQSNISKHTTLISKCAADAEAIVSRLDPLIRSNDGQTQWIRIDQVVKDIVAMAGCCIDNTVDGKPKIDFQTSTTPVQALCHESDIREVLINLVNNAIDAIEGKGQVCLSCRRNGTNVEIEVQDNGKGMNEQVRESCFKTMFSTKRTRGRGLGLSTSLALITTMGGTLTVESQPGQGSTFFVRFPVNRDGLKVESTDVAAQSA